MGWEQLRNEREPLSQTEMWGERQRQTNRDMSWIYLLCSPDHSNKAKITIKQVTQIFLVSQCIY